MIDRQSQCLWHLENHQGDGEWFSFGFLSCLVVLITVRVVVLECVCASVWEKVREGNSLCVFVCDALNLMQKKSTELVVTLCLQCTSELLTLFFTFTAFRGLFPFFNQNENPQVKRFIHAFLFFSISSTTIQHCLHNLQALQPKCSIQPNYCYFSMCFTLFNSYNII